jgi:hypothetical protein
MDFIEFGVLESCQEFILRQREMLPHLAAALDVPEQQVFYKLVLGGSRNRGHLKDAHWAYYPHGFECDLKNTQDGRYLRIDFGPGGQVGMLNSWGVLQFIMTSVSPWREFPELKTYFARGDPPYDQYSGDSAKISKAWDRLARKGAFETANPDLVALESKYSTRGPDGLTHIKFPPEITDENRVDCAVAHRQVLSPAGIQLLKSGLYQQGIGLESVPVENMDRP